MSDDDDHRPLAYRADRMPVVSQRMHRPSLPDLPSSSGAWWRRRSPRVKNNAAFVRVHADYLDARKIQTDSFRALVDARAELYKSLARLEWLPEEIETAYQLGRLSRQSEITIARIEHETAEAHARVRLLEVLQVIEKFLPAPPPPQLPAAAPSRAQGLTPAEVEHLAQQLPEIKPETIRTLSILLSGFLAEKNS